MLIEYDKYNHTDYLNFLESYIACDFSIHALAAKTFLHRNTVYYKLGKIESILNQDLNHWNTRLNLILCLCIKNLL
ncbi:helix-turn-helix domain-containing protein [Lactonifactor longoviformis]|uniref:PucR family transcriptional regulator n=1 Tax=Lactonifactor longoviformis TaxID=341220 RepID=UPI001315425C